jgi:DNA-binding response OmpR family regulator
MMLATVLVIAADRYNAAFLTDVLEDEGYDVHVFATPAQACAYPALTPPDVVLLDLLACEGDGMDAILMLRTHPTIAHRPLIALVDDASARATVRRHTQAVLHKPFSVQQLLQCLQSVSVSSQPEEESAP